MKLNASTGFTLVEVLVSIFVLSLGMLCAATMQLTALRTVQQSSFQSISMQLAVEMANQIRASNAQFASDESRNPYLLVDYHSAIAPELPTALCFTRDVNCLPDEMAKFNIYDWEKKISAMLPEGRARICMDAAPWDNAAHQYRWECATSSDGASQLVIKLGWREKNPEGASTPSRPETAHPLLALVVGI